MTLLDTGEGLVGRLYPNLGTVFLERYGPDEKCLERKDKNQRLEIWEEDFTKKD